jgi:predicted SAM-dependent methyltransferase
MNYYINIGCARSPTEGWKNYDNSPAIMLSNSPLKYFLAKSLGLLNNDHIENVAFLRKNKIEFSDATQKIPLPDNSVIALYSCHMLEHLSRDGALKFLNEARRVLSDNGVIRIAVPDLEKVIADYNVNKSADHFMQKMLVNAPPISSVKEKINLFISGYRHHQWMYDEESLISILVKQGFRNVTVQSNGKTFIKEVGKLNLFERSEESVIVEAIK